MCGIVLNKTSMAKIQHFCFHDKVIWSSICPFRTKWKSRENRPPTLSQMCKCFSTMCTFWIYFYRRKRVYCEWRKCFMLDFAEWLPVILLLSLLLWSFMPLLFYREWFKNTNDLVGLILYVFLQNEEEAIKKPTEKLYVNSIGVESAESAGNSFVENFWTKKGSHQSIIFWEFSPMKWRKRNAHNTHSMAKVQVLILPRTHNVCVCIEKNID